MRRALADVLRTYYSSAADQFGYYDEAHLRMVLEDQATEERLNAEFARLADPDVVQPEDSVLVYFAGHAVRLDTESRKSGDAVAVLPYNVQLAKGEVIGNAIGLPHEMIAKKLAGIPAKHKLLVLDCCFSGEIFELPAYDGIAFKARSSEANDRSDVTLQYEPAFQALASCRRSQTASDGKQDHSPFTAALIDGLKRLPARTPRDRRVWSSRLLYHIRPSFSENQRPDCRNLVGMDGEFCFQPAPHQSFEEFMVAASEENLLKASVASRQGNWWFNEMPWFIPSVRERIIKKYEQNEPKVRSTSVAELIDPHAIRKAARNLP